eukprot:376608-Hanusia_phi.AAC.2
MSSRATEESTPPESSTATSSLRPPHAHVCWASGAGRGCEISWRCCCPCSLSRSCSMRDLNVVSMLLSPSFLPVGRNAFRLADWMISSDLSPRISSALSPLSPRTSSASSPLATLASASPPSETLRDPSSSTWLET